MPFVGGQIYLLPGGMELIVERDAEWDSGKEKCKRLQKSFPNVPRLIDLRLFL